jgi:hypothetical protein
VAVTIFGYSLTYDILTVIVLFMGFITLQYAMARRDEAIERQTRSICERLDIIAGELQRLSLTVPQAPFEAAGRRKDNFPR